jgi:hypothetical protein
MPLPTSSLVVLPYWSLCSTSALPLLRRTPAASSKRSKEQEACAGYAAELDLSIVAWLALVGCVL